MHDMARRTKECIIRHEGQSVTKCCDGGSPGRVGSEMTATVLRVADTTQKNPLPLNSTGACQWRRVLSSSILSIHSDLAPWRARPRCVSIDSVPIATP